MKRLSLQFFALLFIFCCGHMTAVNAAQITQAVGSFANDADGNGYINYGDRLLFQATISPELDHDTVVWDQYPYVDLSSLNMGQPLMIRNESISGRYELEVTLNTWSPTNQPNFSNVSISIGAQIFLSAADSRVVDFGATDQRIDIVPVDGTGANVAINTVAETITVSITDNNYQALPAPGTRAWVDMSPLGGAASVQLDYQGGNVFSRVFPFSDFPNTSYTGPVNITLRDPFFPAHPEEIYPSNTFTYENQPNEVTISSAEVTMVSEAIVSGVGNIGDRIRIRAVATYTLPATAWTTPPTVNLGSIGLGNVELNQEGTTDTYSAEVVLIEQASTPNFLGMSFVVSATSNSGQSATRGTSPLFDMDLVRVSGNTAQVTPSSVGSNRAFTISINDANYQAQPSETVATVNLTPIGGNAAEPMVHTAGGNFSVDLNSASFPSITYTGPLMISLRDPFYPAITYPANIIFNNQEPSVDEGQTQVIIYRPDNQVADVALPGYRIRVIGTVDNYDGSTQVWASAPALIPAAISSANGTPANSNEFEMTLRNSTGAGNPAQWHNDIIVQEANLRNMSLPVTITFRNNVGDLVIQTRDIKVDLKKPAFVGATTRVLMPGGAPSVIADVATTTCILRFDAEVTDDGDDDIDAVTVNLSYLGGPTNYALTRTDPALFTYSSEYTINAGNRDDLNKHPFVISARDSSGNLVAEITTPPIGIDNVAPVITSASVTNPGGHITVGDFFTIEANVTGLEVTPAASVTVDLSDFGLTAVEPLSLVSGNTYRGTFELPLSTESGAIVVEESRRFTVSANDTVLSEVAPTVGTHNGHIVSRDTNQIFVDNRPPFIVDEGYEPIPVASGDNPGADSPPAVPGVPYVRIGDELTFYAEVASDPQTVTVNLSQFGMNSAQNMWYDSTNDRWQYIMPGGIQPGTINVWGASNFTITATDWAGNATSTVVPIYVDNQRIQATDFTVEVDYIPGQEDGRLDIINLNKTVAFEVQFVVPVPDDVVSCLIDLTSIGGAADVAMTRAGNTFTLPAQNVLETNIVSSSHQFTARLYDKAGNLTEIMSSPLQIDTDPPAITLVSATPQMPEPLIIGNEILFRAEVTNNGSIAPTVDLTSIGGSSAQALSLISAGVYEYTAVVGTGTLNNIGETFTIRASDSGANFVEATTAAIYIDNLPPQVHNGVTGITVSVNGDTSPEPREIKLGDNLVFTINLITGSGLEPAPNEGTARIDLRPVGGSNNTLMTWSAPGTYETTITADAASAAYSNYQFRALVRDEHGNRFETFSAAFDDVDCQPVELSNHGIIVNNDPALTIAKIGDTITVFASATAHIGANITATIGSGTAPAVDFETVSMTYVAARNRHEGTITVKEAGTGTWINLQGTNIYYRIEATDTIGNVSTPVTDDSTFLVYNATPVIDNFVFTLSPNFALADFGGPPADLVFNLGADSVGDKLHASITFDAGVPVQSAWVDFADLGTGTVSMQVSSDFAETAAGITLDKLPPTNWVRHKIYIRAQDPGGNQAEAEEFFWVDNLRPTVNSLTFDGATLTVVLSEEVANLEIDGWTLVGSDTTVTADPVYMNFVGAQVTGPFFDSFDISLTNAQRQEIAQWASTPLYMRIQPVGGLPAITDMAQNGIEPVNFYPVTITDSSFREPPVITQFAMQQTWPTEIRLDLFFNKDMSQELDSTQPYPTIASNAVIFVDNLTDDFDYVDYTKGYIFQSTDTYNWVSSDRLRITLSADARDWVARKLSNDPAKKLKFATREPGKVFAYDEFGKAMSHLSVTNAIEAIDNRPVASFSFSPPVINIASKTIKLATANSDRMLLYTNDFRTDVANPVPTMLMPIPTFNRRVQTFHDQIVLHDIDSGTSKTLKLEALDMAINNVMASSTVTLHLTHDDLLAVFDMFKANENADWRIEVKAGAFTSLWNAPSRRYVPSGPGNIIGMDNLPSGYDPAMFAASSMSDKPPTNQKETGELSFELEIYPPEIDGVIVPIQSQVQPTARIARQDVGNTTLAAGNFVSYSERTVDGKLRSVFRYTNATPFPENEDRQAAVIIVDGIEDIFGGSYSITASYAYDLSTKNSSVVEGFTDTASAPIEIDTLKPTVLSITPGDSIGRLPVGSDFFVEFSEPMDTSAIFYPTLRVATEGQTINFTFAGWVDEATASNTAKFNNDLAFTGSTPNGAWQYQVLGGYDESGNQMNQHNQTIQVRTYAPNVEPGNVTLRTVQGNIDPTVLINQPWSPDIGNATFSIRYTQVPTQFLPHRLEIINPVNGDILGTELITSVGINATATFSLGDLPLGAIGPNTYQTRVVDAELNRTEALSSIVYDMLAPNVDFSTFNIQNVASHTADATYYNKTSNFVLSFFTLTTTDELRLAVNNHTTNSTSTIDLERTNTYYSLTAGMLWNNGTYTLTPVDMAGNQAAESRVLVVDNIRPEVDDIRPAYAVSLTNGPWYLPNAPQGTFEINVTFTEAMDADPTYRPKLWLASSTAADIQFDFDRWLDPLVASTAVYVNASEITQSIAPGTYTFKISDGRDLAGNNLRQIADGDFTIIVQSDGVFAHIDTLTNQQHIYGSTPTMQTNLHFNGVAPKPAATLRITYPGMAFNTPHDLAVFDGATQIGTYTDLLNNPVGSGYQITTDDANWSWDVPPAWSLAGNRGAYDFRIVDGNGVMSGSNLPQALRYDTEIPNLTNVNIISSGIASTSGSVPGYAWYYSPLAGDATFELTTSNNENLRLAILDYATPATYTEDMISADERNHSVAYGSALAHGIYAITAVDLAGNLADGPASITALVVDSVAPTVSSVSPALIGGMIAGAGTFDITFDEPMNTASVPEAQLASGSNLINLQYVAWLDSYTCRFTNAVDIDDTYPQGMYSYLASGATDLAGNANVVPAVGDYLIELFTEKPTFVGRLISQQPHLYGNVDLLNQPFSPVVAPGVATLSIDYSKGPFQVPHTLRVYDFASTQVATFTINPDTVARKATATVDAAFFAAPGAIGPVNYSYQILDDIGNLSPLSAHKIVYDAVAPEVSGSQFIGTSDTPVFSPLYYNEAFNKPLEIALFTDATDTLKLVMADGVATHTFDMASGATTGEHRRILSIAEAAALPEAVYTLTAADLAGNMAYGSASTTILVIDRTPPDVLVATTTTGLSLSSGPAGAASFTLTFNEPLNTNASPTLTIATHTHEIACEFIDWLDAAGTQAIFTTAVAVSNNIPQGDYVYKVKAWDMTGNMMDIATGSLAVRSRGPVVQSFVTRSFQSTTASSTDEILVNQPFSFGVAPGAATLSVKLSRAPDELPVSLHFMLDGSSADSYPLTFDANWVATFTWQLGNGPNPVNPTTYSLRLTDGTGDYSVESHLWRLDNARPIVNTPSVTRGVLATATVYFNPARHTYLSIQANSPETEAFKLRMRSAISTDTYAMNLAAPNTWVGDFDGYHSRGTPRPVMEDGEYLLDFVDLAGNVALKPDATPINFRVIIDTQEPVVATYSLWLNSVPVTSFSPSAGNLEIRVVAPAETLDETGVYQVNVLNQSGVTIKQLKLENVAGNYTAFWDGTDKDGTLVIDGYYRFRAADYAGNMATEHIEVFALTSKFRASGVTQTGQSSAQIWFNQEIDATSIPGAGITSTGLTISNLAVADGSAISFDVSPAFEDQKSYTFTVTPGTVKSVHGAVIAAPDNTAIMVADAKGPEIVDVNFEGLSSQREFKVIFDEEFKPDTASVVGNYTLVGPNGAVEIVAATTQSDLKTVLLRATSDLVENANYTISVSGIEDQFGNPSPIPNSYTFKARDLTPPVLTVSAFSNPANERDIIVVVTANEALKAAPSLTIAQSNAPVVTAMMQPGAATESYMVGVTLNSSYSGNGTLTATADDLSGNRGTGTSNFVVANVSAAVASIVESADGQLKLSFMADSLKEDAVVKLLHHELEKIEFEEKAEISASLQRYARAAISSLRGSNSGADVAKNHVELVPFSDAYEVGIAAEKVDKGFNVYLFAPAAEDTTGLGLFYQKGDSWQFITSDLSKDGTYGARASSAQIFAIMRDIQPPRISMAGENTLGEPFHTARPEFSGKIEDHGAGVDRQSVEASIDNGPAQPVQVDSQGRFKFIPQADLTGGTHDLVIRASDRTGNVSETASMRFQVVVPLEIHQIMQYPNPARHRMFVRISANRRDLDDDLVRIRIFDSAGHKVADLSGVRPVRENWGVNSRYLYDIPWDLRNSSGRNVANGVYFARIDVRDPDNPSARVRKTFKLAVLR